MKCSAFGVCGWMKDLLNNKFRGKQRGVWFHTRKSTQCAFSHSLSLFLSLPLYLSVTSNYISPPLSLLNSYLTTFVVGKSRKSFSLYLYRNESVADGVIRLLFKVHKTYSRQLSANKRLFVCMCVCDTVTRVFWSCRLPNGGHVKTHVDFDRSVDRRWTRKRLETCLDASGKCTGLCGWRIVRDQIGRRTFG